MPKFKLEPIRKDVIFQFVDKVTAAGNFKEDTDWGFVIETSEKDRTNSTHKMCNILSVGPDCKIVKPGMQVIVEDLMWTRQFDCRGEQCWKTDESKVLAIVE